MTRRVCGLHFSRLFLGLVVVVAGVLIAVAVPTPAHAATIWVSTLGSDTAGDGSAGNPYATVQHGIDSTSSAADVLVGPGTFVGDIAMKSGVSIYGSGAATTTLQGTGAGPVITASASSDTTISGFTITKGDGGSSSGGGIQCSYVSQLAIADCTIADNTSAYGGGGICCYMSSPAIVGCLVTNNTATGGSGGGGGIYCYQGTPTIIDDTIATNTAAFGGGILCDTSAATISKSTIDRNVATFGGGGVYCTYSNATITDNTIAHNTATNYSGGVYCYSCSPTITGNTIDENTATGPSSSGGGMRCYQASPIISGNTITGNSAAAVGGGISCEANSAPAITNNTVTDNSAITDGGGILCDHSSPTIAGNDIRRNTVSSGGGGIIAAASSSPTIKNNVIADNEAGGYGSGIFCESSSIPVIINDTFAENSQPAYGGGAVFSDAALSITNCIVWGNGDDLANCTATYSDISNVSVASGLGNTTVAPSFVDTAAGDFHLNSGSPCIDNATSTAAPAVDIAGVSRPQGGGIDMGAYEYVVQTHRLHYAADAHGSIVGSATQVVDHGGSAAAVTASATVGYHFLGWSDAHSWVSTDNPLAVANVTSDATYTASFAIDTHTLTYTAESGGSIVGAGTQVVDYGASGSSVTASATAGYHFVSWSDGSTANPRTDTNVVADTAVSARFALTTYALPTTTKLAGSSSVKLKKTYKLTGTVSPAGPGKVTITMTRLVRKKSKSAGSVTVRVSGGKFTFSFKPKYKGSWYFVARYSGGVVGVTTYNPSKSATKTVKVK